MKQSGISVGQPVRRSSADRKVAEDVLSAFGKNERPPPRSRFDRITIELDFGSLR
jgi:hypothetical protein